MRALLGLTSILTLAAGAALLGADWPSWRGPANNGVSPETGLPVTWGAKCLDELAATPASSTEPPAAAASVPPGVNPVWQGLLRAAAWAGRRIGPMSSTSFRCGARPSEE